MAGKHPNRSPYSQVSYQRLRTLNWNDDFRHFAPSHIRALSGDGIIPARHLISGRYRIKSTTRFSTKPSAREPEQRRWYAPTILHAEQGVWLGCSQKGVQIEGHWAIRAEGLSPYDKFLFPLINLRAAGGDVWWRHSQSCHHELAIRIA